MARARRDQRGAVAVFTALLALSLTIVAGLAVDIGMQRVARSDMQSLADVVALDLARDLDGASPGSSYTTLQTAADASRDRNTTTLGDKPTVTPELGTLSSTGVFTPLASGTAVPNAVRVNASTSVPFLFGVLASGGAGRSSVATASPQGCMRLGSSVLDGQLLGVKLGVASYQSLAGLNLQLSALAVQLGAGTTDQLLATQVTLAQFLTAVVNAADNDSDTTNNSTASVLTTGVLGSLSSNTTLGKVTVGQLLSIGPGDDAALQSTVDILRLVTGAAYVANGTNAIGTGLSLPAGTTVTAYVTEAPRIACGQQGVATTSQVRLEVVQTTALLLGSETITATVSLGTAKGGISSVHCSSGKPDKMVVHVDEQTAASYGAKVRTRTLAGVLSTEITATPGTSTATGTGSYTIALSDPVSSSPKVSTGSGTLVAPTATAAQVSLLGLSITQLSLASDLSSLGTYITGTVLGQLGLRVAGADLYAVSAGCSIPKLAG